MKDLTTKEFCRKFGACKEGAKFARNFATMRECYAALLRGDAGDNSPGWAIWAATRKGVMADRDLRIFAVRCARRVQHLMRDERSILALDVAERYANGAATIEELNAAKDAEKDAASAASWAAWAAAYAAAYAASAASWAAWVEAEVEAENAAREAEREAQLRILADFGNPFEEVEE